MRIFLLTALLIIIILIVSFSIVTIIVVVTIMFCNIYAIFNLFCLLKDRSLPTSSLRVFCHHSPKKQLCFPTGLFGYFNTLIFGV